MNIAKIHSAVLVLALALVLAACGKETETIIETVIQEVEVEVTRVVTQTVVEEGETVEVTRVVVETETELVEVEVTAVPEPEPVSAEPPSEPQTGGDLRIWQPNSWPQQSWPHSNNWESIWAINPMGEGLFFPLPDGTMDNGLGTGIEVSNDGLVYTVSLREGVTWHDGELFTSQDYIYSMHVLYSPDFRPVKGLRQGRTIVDLIAYHDGEAESITGIEAIDDYTLQFTLSSPDAGFARLFLACACIIIPEHIVSQLDRDQVMNGTAHYWFTNPIGTGPYKFVQYVPGQFIEYERYGDYWGGAPGPDRLFMEISTAEVASLKLLRGELDLVNPIGPLDISLLANSPAVEIMAAENNAQWYGLEMNYATKDGLWQNPKAKQALLYSIDRQAYVDSILQGLGVVRHSFFDGTPYACPTMTVYNYDPVKAAELWAEIGINPEDVTIDLMSWLGLNARRDYLPIAQEYLRAQGFKVNVDFVDNSLITEYIQGNGPRGVDWDFHVLLFGPGADPGGILPFITPGAGTNWGYRSWPESPNPTSGVKDNARYYEHPDLPALIEQAREETDPAARTELYQQIDCIWNHDQPALTTASPSFLAARSTRLQGVDWQSNAGPDLWMMMYRLEDWWLWAGK